MKTKWADIGIVPKHGLATTCVQRTFSTTVLIGAMICTLGAAAAGPSDKSAPDLVDKLRFTTTDGRRYVFDTGVLRGELRQAERTIGLTSLVHVPSGTRLDGTYGIFSYYRIFTSNKRYGHAAWEWPCASKLLPDGAVQIFWPADENRPIEMSATYRLTGPSTIDLETVVKAQKDLPQFEVFLASYFRETFPVPCVYVGENPEAEGKPGFLTAKKPLGDWQMFPRDEHVLPLIRDGRWQKEPNPVEWVIMPYMAAPVGIRRNTSGDLTAILMAPPEDCFAISTPYEGEGHYSLYMSLFGRDIKAGEKLNARSRLVIAAGASNEEVLEMYKEYMKELRAGTASNTAP
jgi:hypothetical protein